IAFGEASRSMLEKDLSADVATALPVVEGGRIYANLSNFLTLVRLSSIVDFIPIVDSMAAGALATIRDEADYRAPQKLRPIPWGLLRRAPQIASTLLEARLSPERSRARVEEIAARHAAELDALAGEARPLASLAEEALGRTARLIFQEMLPRFLLAKRSMRQIRSMFAGQPGDTLNLVERLDQSLPGNVTVEMGMALADLVPLLPGGLDLDALVR